MWTFSRPIFSLVLITMLAVWYWHGLGTLVIVVLMMLILLHGF